MNLQRHYAAMQDQAAVSAKQQRPLRGIPRTIIRIVGMLAIIFGVFMVVMGTREIRAALGPQAGEVTKAQLSHDAVRWQQAGITNYRITVADRAGFVTRTETVTVRNGVVVDQSATCTPTVFVPTCTTSAASADAYTVPGLFTVARGFLNDGNARRVTTVESDPTYGYPRTISSDITGTNDLASAVQVLDFQVLP